MARLAFTSWKLKIRSNLAITHAGPETLEEAVQDYINRNTDLVDLPSLVAVRRNPPLYRKASTKRRYRKTYRKASQTAATGLSE